MRDYKYVAFEGRDGKEYTVMFPILKTHSVVAAQVGDVVLGGGFVATDQKTGERRGFGMSISLGVGSRDEDSDLLNLPSNRIVGED